MTILVRSAVCSQDALGTRVVFIRGLLWRDVIDEFARMRLSQRCGSVSSCGLGTPPKHINQTRSGIRGSMIDFEFPLVTIQPVTRFTFRSFSFSLPSAWLGGDYSCSAVFFPDAQSGARHWYKPPSANLKPCATGTGGPVDREPLPKLSALTPSRIRQWQGMPNPLCVPSSRYHATEARDEAC